MRSSRVELYKVKRTREIWFPSRRLTHERRTTWFTWDHVLFSPSLSLPSSLFLYLSTEARLVSLTLVAKDSLPFLLRFLQESQKLFVRQISSFFSFFFSFSIIPAMTSSVGGNPGKDRTRLWCTIKSVQSLLNIYECKWVYCESLWTPQRMPPIWIILLYVC